MSDGELVERACGGDDAAFVELYRRHRGSVRAVAARRCFGHEIDDVVQETFARVIPRLGDLRKPDRFGQWVRGICANICADLGRAGARERVCDPDTLHEQADDDAYEQVEASVLVAQGLAVLDGRNAAALMARDGYDLPVAAVAAMTGRTLGSERVQASRSRELVAAAIGRLAVLLGLLRIRPRRVAALAPALAAVVLAPAVIVGGWMLPERQAHAALSPATEQAVGSAVGLAAAQATIPVLSTGATAAPVAVVPRPPPPQQVTIIPGVLAHDTDPPTQEESDVVVVVCDPVTGDRQFEYRRSGYGPRVGTISTCEGPLTVAREPAEAILP